MDQKLRLNENGKKSVLNPVPFDVSGQLKNVNNQKVTAIKQAIYLNFSYIFSRESGKTLLAWVEECSTLLSVMSWRCWLSVGWCWPVGSSWHIAMYININTESETKFKSLCLMFITFAITACLPNYTFPWII